MKKLGNKLAYILIGVFLALAGTVYAVNVTIPQSNQKGAIPVGNSNGTYNSGFLVAGTNITISTSTTGQISISASGGAVGNAAWTIGNALIYNATSTDLVGVGTITPTTTFFIQGKGGTNPFNIVSSTGTSLFSVSQAGAVAVPNTLTVTGQTTLSTASSTSITNSGILYNGGNIQMTQTPTSTVTTSGTALEMIETGDTFGQVRLSLQNRTGVNGALFANDSTGVAAGLVDFVFKPDYNSVSSQRNIRIENRGGSVFVAGPEFEFGLAGNPNLVVNDNTVYVRTGNLGVATTTPLAKLAVVGNGYFSGTLTVQASTTIQNLGTGLVRSASGALWNGLASLSTDVSGVLPVVNGGTATSSAPVSTGQLLAADGTGLKYAPTTLFAGANITITTTTPGQITITGAAGGSGNSAWTIGNALIYNATSTDSVLVGTSTPVTSTFFIQGTGTKNPLNVASSSGTSYLTVAPNGSTTLSSLVAGFVKSTSAGALYNDGSTYLTTIGSGNLGYGARWNGANTLAQGALMDNGTVLGLNASSSTISLNVQGVLTQNPFVVASSTGTSILQVNANGNIVIGTGSTTPASRFVISSTATNTIPALSILTPSGAPSFEIRDPGAPIGVNGNAYAGLYAGMTASSTAIGNAAFGYNALKSNVASWNTAFGNDALFSNTNGPFNTAIGDAALYFNTTGKSNTGVGEGALLSNTTGNSNTGLGDDALYNNTIASFNTAVGEGAMYSNIDGINNVAIGAYSLNTMQNGTGTLAIGYFAGQVLATSSDNTLIGNNNGNHLKSGNQNTFLGSQAGSTLTTSTQNTLIGYNAGETMSSSSGNTMLGWQSGFLSTTGNNNTFLGWQAGVNNTTGSTNVYIGYRAGQNETTASNQLEIANNKLWPLIWGDMNNGYVNINSTSTVANLYVQGTSTSPTALILNIASSTGTSYLNVSAKGIVGIGSSTPTGLLTLQGSATQSNNIFTVASSTNAAVFSILNSGDIKITSVATSSTAFLMQNPSGQTVLQVDETQTTAGLSVGTTSTGSTLVIQGTGTTQITNIASSSGASIFAVTAASQVGVNTSTPIADFQATNSVSSATTTIELGRGGMGKGTCLKMYDGAGTAWYIAVNAAGSLVVTSGTCKSGF